MILTVPSYVFVCEKLGTPYPYNRILECPGQAGDLTRRITDRSDWGILQAKYPTHAPGDTACEYARDIQDRISYRPVCIFQEVTML